MQEERVAGVIAPRAVGVRASPRICADGEEVAHDANLPECRRDEEGPRAIDSRLLDVGAASDEQPARFDLAVFRRDEERRLASVELGQVGRRASREEPRDAARAVRLRRKEERRTSSR